MMRFAVQFKENEARFPVKFTEFQSVTINPDVEYYEGSCDVIPSIESQVLQTAQKLVPYDVTIQAIPRFDVSNTAGGNTVYIGTAAEMVAQ